MAYEVSNEDGRRRSSIDRGLTWRGEWDGQWEGAWSSQQNVQQDNSDWYYASEGTSNYALTEEQREELRGIFDVSAQSRANNSSSEQGEYLVHRNQLGELLQMLGILLTDEETSRLLQEVSLQNYDEMTFDEFCDVASRVYATYDVHEEIKEAFVAMRESVLTEEGDQFVSASSLLNAFRANGNESVTEDDCVRIVKLIGGDSRITWTDFQYHMMSSAF